MTEETKEAKTDKQGRVIDSTGRPLRDRDSRDHGPVPYRGKPGRAHPRAAKLQARIADYESGSQHSGRRRPGSLSK